MEPWLIMELLFLLYVDTDSTHFRVSLGNRAKSEKNQHIIYGSAHLCFLVYTCRRSVTGFTHNCNPEVWRDKKWHLWPNAITWSTAASTQALGSFKLIRPYHRTWLTRGVATAAPVAACTRIGTSWNAAEMTCDQLNSCVSPKWLGETKLIQTTWKSAAA